jgi:pimeloyl-ACP methyl ester carboxylesterase
MAGAGGGPRGLQLAVSVPLCALRRRPRICTHAGDALLGLVGRHPRLVARVMRTAAASADRHLPAQSEARELAAARFLAAAPRGVGGMIDDYQLCAAPWGFDPAGVPGLVQLWHGMRDALVPVDEAIQLAAALPQVQIELDPDEGHFFYRRRLREILGDLVAPSRRRASRAQLRDARDPRLA